MPLLSKTNESIRATLADDHRRLDALFGEAIEAAEAGVDRRSFGELWSRFDSLLRRHLQAEEDLLFPRLDARHGPEIQRMKAEHDRLRMWLDEVDIAVDMHQARDPAIGALIEGLRAHAAEEEQGAFPL